MNWLNRTLFPAPSVLIGWPADKIRDDDPVLGAISRRRVGGKQGEHIARREPSPIQSAASTLAKAGHAKRQSAIDAMTARLKAEVGG